MAASRKRKSSTALSDLQMAIEFVSLAQNETGYPYQMHCQIREGWIVAQNGTLHAGHRIEDTTLTACPHSIRLRTALQKAKEAVSVTLLASGRLSLVSGPLRALIECVDLLDMPPTLPDGIAAPCNDALRTSLAIIGPLASEGSDTALGASVIFNNGSCLFVDGKLIMEHWHGINLPTCMVPKVAIAALNKIQYPITGLGFSGNTVTFHFENASWLKTQLYNETIPRWADLLNVPINPIPTPVGIFEAIATTAPFSPDSFVHLKPGYVHSHQTEDVGARYECPWLATHNTVNHKQMAHIAPYVTQFDFMSSDRAIYFFGDKIRGAVAKVTPK